MSICPLVRRFALPKIRGPLQGEILKAYYSDTPFSMNSECYVWQAVELPWESRFHKKFGIGNHLVQSASQFSKPIELQDPLQGKTVEIWKIGSTLDWYRRSTGLSTALPMGMRKLLTLECAKQKTLEYILQKRFGRHCIKGELFHVPVNTVSTVKQEIITITAQLNPLLSRIAVWERSEPHSHNVSVVNDKQCHWSTPLKSTIATQEQRKAIDDMIQLRENICKGTIELNIINQMVAKYMATQEEAIDNPHGLIVSCPPISMADVEMEDGPEWQELRTGPSSDETDFAAVRAYQPKRARTENTTCQPQRPTTNTLIKMVRELYGDNRLRDCLKLARIPTLKVSGMSLKIEDAKSLLRLKRFAAFAKQLDGRYQQPSTYDNYCLICVTRLCIQGNRDQDVAQLEILKTQLAASMVNTSSELMDASNKILATYAWSATFDREMFKNNHPDEYNHIIASEMEK